MNYKIYKLCFAGPCHFGCIQGAAGLERSLTNCLSDTLFSALANEAINLYGQSGLDQLLFDVNEKQLRLSDLFPYRDDSDFYLPRPILTSTYKSVNSSSLTRMSKIKELKKIEFIPVYLYQEYVEAVVNNQLVEFYESYKDELHLSVSQNVQTRVSLQGEKSLPYSVGSVSFPKNSGLYCLVSTDDEYKFDWLTQVFTSLGYSGIGGKRSSGYGRFSLTMEDLDDELSDLLSESTGKAISLSTIIPSDDDLPIVDQGNYSLVARGGFIMTSMSEDSIKKRNRYFAIKSGSTFDQVIEGNLIDVGAGNSHPVYRMGKGLFIKVKL